MKSYAKTLSLVLQVFMHTCLHDDVLSYLLVQLEKTPHDFPSGHTLPA